MNADLSHRFPEVDPRDPATILAATRTAIDGRIVFTTSFGLEDQVITHLIASAGLAVDIATIDTGRLFAETYEVWARTEERYGLRIRSVHPDADGLATLLAAQGVNGFYASVAARKACCETRKVVPLGHLLAGAAAWVTGLRADQSGARSEVSHWSRDEARNLLKVSPLAGWSRADVAAYADRQDIPRNALHAQGFLSIGCAPCTRAVAPSEPERAGRWWWEAEAGGECGLHITPDGRLVRAAAPAAEGIPA
ncbi:MAG: phosphoadenylyl-sulfate reductase [Phreatobacter sp.]|nr:phosphoadenylyl-sulfate reductase [Phreatobacter sp.]